MEIQRIRFKNLPFIANERQVFYVENSYSQDVNDFIEEHYFYLHWLFELYGFEFYYLPKYFQSAEIEKKVRYYAPYLSEMILANKVQSNALLQYLDEDKEVGPSLIFGAKSDRETGETVFLQIDISDYVDNSRYAWKAIVAKMDGLVPWGHTVTKESIRKECLISKINEEIAPMECRRSIRREPPMLSSIKNSISLDESRSETEEEERQSLVETERILKELRMNVQRLRLEGISLMAIHEFIDKQEPLSRMTITEDYRIFLPDYNNMEIVMGALPKAVYFLFLRYPKGIVCKHMPDYYNELLGIYKQLRPGTDEARLNLTITKVVNPLGNALNENIARVRKAFVEKFDEHLANKYIITGERGLLYSVPLDRELITWEE